MPGMSGYYRNNNAFISPRYRILHAFWPIRIQDWSALWYNKPVYTRHPVTKRPGLEALAVKLPFPLPRPRG